MGILYIYVYIEILKTRKNCFIRVPINSYLIFHSRLKKECTIRIDERWYTRSNLLRKSLEISNSDLIGHLQGKKKRSLCERNSVEREVSVRRDSEFSSHDRVNVCVHATDFLSEDYWREIKIAFARSCEEGTRGIRM